LWNTDGDLCLVEKDLSKFTDLQQIGIIESIIPYKNDEILIGKYMQI